MNESANVGIIASFPLDSLIHWVLLSLFIVFQTPGSVVGPGC